MDSLTTRLAQRLDELERSAAWLGRKVNVNRGTAHRWARGEMRCAPEHRESVAEAVELQASELFTDDGSLKLPARNVAA